MSEHYMSVPFRCIQCDFTTTGRETPSVEYTIYRAHIHAAHAERKPVMAETTALSRIYTKLIIDIECVGNVDIQEPERSQCVQLISDAFGEAIQLYTQRCVMCDSSDIVIVCKDCMVPPWMGKHSLTDRGIDDSDELADELEAELKSRGVM